MQQYKIHTNFQALPLDIQVQEQSKSKKEMALSTVCGRKPDSENNRKSEVISLFKKPVISFQHSTHL